MSLDSKNPRFKELWGPDPGPPAFSGTSGPNALAPCLKLAITEGKRAQVLVVDADPFYRLELAARIYRKYSIHAVLTSSLEEAASAVRDRMFDIIFFGNPDWERGLLLYLDILNEQKNPCQFILFIDGPEGVESSFKGMIEAVRKPDFEALIAAANWSAGPRGIAAGPLY